MSRRRFFSPIWSQTGASSEVVVKKVSFSGQGNLDVSYVPGQNVVVTTPSSLTQLAG